MDSAQVLASLTGASGMLFGAYGAWRSWRTDRSLRLLGENWRITHFQNDAWLLENRMSSTARQIVLKFSPGTSLMATQPELVDLRPGQKVKVLVFISIGGTDMFEIEWSTGRKRHRTSQTLFLPPKSAPPVKVVSPRAGEANF